MKINTVAFAAGLSVLCATSALGQNRDRDIFGSRVIVQPRNGPRLQGELLAANADSLWILTQNGLRSMTMNDISQVRIDRRKLGAQMAWIWSLGAGALSGALLSAACSSVTTGCGGVFIGTMGLWALYGAISAPSMQRVRYQTISDPRLNFRWQELRARARFPQGMPEERDFADAID